MKGFHFTFDSIAEHRKTQVFFMVLIRKFTTNHTNNTNSYFDIPLLFVMVRVVRG